MTPASSVLGYHVTVNKGGHLLHIVLPCGAKKFEIEWNCEIFIFLYRGKIKVKNIIK